MELDHRDEQSRHPDGERGEQRPPDGGRCAFCAARLEWAVIQESEREQTHGRGQHAEQHREHQCTDRHHEVGSADGRLRRPRIAGMGHETRCYRVQLV